MDFLISIYNHLDEKILKHLHSGGILHRPKSSTGLWLCPLVGITAVATFLREDTSYSEICLLVGVTGIGLIISSACLILQLSIDNTATRDFQIIYFLPAGLMSMLYLLWANKGLIASVSWGLGAGSLSTWGVLQVMSHFPRCFTLGESTAVTHGVVLFLLSSWTNFPLRYHLPPLHDDDIATIILQVCIIFVGVLCLLSTYFPAMQATNVFYFTTLSLLVVFVIPILHVLLDRSPLLWMLFFVFGNARRVLLVIYWAICLLIGAGLLAYQILSDNHATTADRKIFHFLAVFVYIPGVIWEPTLLYLASGIIMGVFLMLELLRLMHVPPLGTILQSGFSSFVDEKDSLVSLTPLYLHAGLSFPLWMPTNSLELLPILSGVLTVGVGDAAASVVGVKWGKRKWPNSTKTLEGTFACILSQLAMIFTLIFLGFIPDWSTVLRTTLTVTGLSFVEARTDQVDNLVLPLLFYISLLV